MILAVPDRDKTKKMYATHVIEGIRNYMLAANETLSVAESVTSGHLQAALSLATDASRFFQGGITVYNLGQKTRHLHVDPIRATSCNSVSQGIADEMAVNANRLFSSDWSIAVTGYASPYPEIGVDDLFAFYAIAKRGRIVLQARVEADDLGLLNVQTHYANHILSDFRSYLLKVERASVRAGRDNERP